MYLIVVISLLFSICNAQEPDERKGICMARNGYFKVDNSCDAYYECKDYQPTKMMCPDGLNYNPNSDWPNYPCSYPADVPCKDRDRSQPPQPTAECPHQYGFFRSPLAAEGDCGQYRLCSQGQSFDMVCPFGLAFNLAIARCDWPENVPGCNTQAFLGFTCPSPQYDANGNPLVTNYAYEGSCYLFFSCQSGLARVLSCDPGLAFDPISSTCVDADKVDCDSYNNKNNEDDVPTVAPA